MSSWRDRLRRLNGVAGALLSGAGLVGTLLVGAVQAGPNTAGQMAAQVAAHNERYPGIGRAATAKELAVWDIDVRPDFKGLPKGSGTVAKGMVVWESKCESCHGVFGESNQVFNPIVGGTTRDDIKTGRVARLNDAAYPARTTLMKVSSLSTLWDYINRAMPWATPKSLSVEEVYAVTAYILNMADVLPDNFTLSDQNMADVQRLLPNRNGTTTAHALWPGAGLGKTKPDVSARACMKDCAPAPVLASFLPDFARDAHGNLSEQNRAVGAQVGADTSRPGLAQVTGQVTGQIAAQAAASGATSGAAGSSAEAAPATPTKLAVRPVASGAAVAALALASKHSCTACHSLEGKLLGPSFREVAKKYAGRADGVAYLAGKIKAGGSGLWGAIPMPAQALSEAEAKTIAQWLHEGAKQ